MSEPRICFVNCGLPADQCACYRSTFGSGSPHDDPELRRIIDNAKQEISDIFRKRTSPPPTEGESR